ncbi:MAG: HAD-IB family hydrolase [Chloroflexi bacterium]|nr:HAD-IB family hydrolase [Chloroflexota bacterium]
MGTPVAFFDVDGTLTRVHVWQGFMAYFQRHKARLWTHRGFWAYHFPLFLLHKIKLLPQTFVRGQWAAHLAWYVRGMSVEEAEPIWRWVVEAYLAKHWREIGLQRVQWHKGLGHPVVLVSSGPKPLVVHIARALGVRHVIATEFQVREGRYTGRAFRPVIGERKAQRAWAYVRARGWRTEPRDAWAYGDSISDLPLLESVHHPVVIEPDPELARVAQARGWPILRDTST